MLQKVCVAAVRNDISLPGSQGGLQRLSLTGVSGILWPVTALGMNSELGQLGTALGHNEERAGPAESSCYRCLLTATIEASVTEEDKEIWSILAENGRRNR